MTLFLLWNEICESSEIPCDVRRYLTFHFISPFEKAERERVRVNEIYDGMMIKECDGLFSSKQAQAYKPQIKALLKDASLEFNPYIGDSQRITRLIIIFQQIWSYKDNKVPLALLKKGLLLDDMLAFRLLYLTPLIVSCEGVTEFVMRASKRYLALPSWNKHLYNIKFIIFYCLDKELDNIIIDFMSAAEQKDVNPFDPEYHYSMISDFTKKQRICYSRIQNQYILFH